MFCDREARRMVADTSQVLTEAFPEASPSICCNSQRSTAERGAETGTERASIV